eukprot:s1431_g7.t1
MPGSRDGLGEWCQRPTMRSSWSVDDKAKLPPLSRSSRSPGPGEVSACKSSSVLSGGVLARRRAEPHRLDPLQGGLPASSMAFDATPSFSSADANLFTAKAPAATAPMDGKRTCSGRPKLWHRFKSFSSRSCATQGTATQRPRRPCGGWWKARRRRLRRGRRSRSDRQSPALEEDGDGEVLPQSLDRTEGLAEFLAPLRALPNH